MVCQDSYSKAGNKVYLHVPNQCHTQERHTHLAEPLNFAFFPDGCLITETSLAVWRMEILDLIHCLLSWFKPAFLKK